jgi:hypothetical protein
VRRALCALLLVAAGPGCATLAGLVPPDVHVANLVPLEATLFEQSVRVDLRVLNPNDVDLAVRGLRFALRVNGEVLARGASGESLVVPRFSDVLVPVTTRSTSLALLRQLISPPPDGVFAYELEGDLLLERFAPRKLGFERSGSFSLAPVAPRAPAERLAPATP